MNKKDILNLGKWLDYSELEFDYIYIVPMSKKVSKGYCDGYRIAYYIGKIGEEYKIIDMYDCGSIFMDMGTNKYFMLNWDFEDIFGGIKIWSNNHKLKYEYGGRIAIKF